MVGQGFVTAVLALAVCGSATSPPLVVPPLPRGVEETSIYNLWNHHNGRVPAVERGESFVGTILSPDFFKMVNLVPQDAPHPLYGDRILRTRFLLDHMLQRTVDPNDQRMMTSSGLQALTMAGSRITFKKNSNGETKVNEALVNNVEVLPNGIVVYHISDILFNYKEEVQREFSKLTSEGYEGHF
ncbi:uncharacterized protein LOC125027341 [Penaeus chinensis]|uniref:uncharacterized protein LOC125027341 n=1 Tax=Penaeus chinensis TaxID=139456 RepID=UPI001FB59184|nr:uncharacterized protein LOC125027341 [Penaeus chinensis]